jgi:hypothetical protein
MLQEDIARAAKLAEEHAEELIMREEVLYTYNSIHNNNARGAIIIYL